MTTTPPSTALTLTVQPCNSKSLARPVICNTPWEHFPISSLCGLCSLYIILLFPLYQFKLKTWPQIPFKNFLKIWAFQLWLSGILNSDENIFSTSDFFILHPGNSNVHITSSFTIYKNKIPLFWTQMLLLAHVTFTSYGHFCLEDCTSHCLQSVSGLFRQLTWVRSESFRSLMSYNV